MLHRVDDAKIETVSLGIIIPIVLLFAFLGGGLAWYKQAMQNMAPDQHAAPGQRRSSDQRAAAGAATSLPRFTGAQLSLSAQQQFSRCTPR
jgi:hypothetical protein